MDAVVDENRTFGDGVLALQLADLLAHAPGIVAYSLYLRLC